MKILLLCLGLYTGWHLYRDVLRVVNRIRNAGSPWLDIGRLGSGGAGAH